MSVKESPCMKMDSPYELIDFGRHRSRISDLNTLSNSYLMSIGHSMGAKDSNLGFVSIFFTVELKNVAVPAILDMC